MTEANIKTCEGEAHTNAHVDNCMLCAPFWYIIPVCPYCDCMLIKRLSLPTGLCPEHGDFILPRSDVLTW